MSQAEVVVDGEQIASIGSGMLVLVGVVPSDTENDASTMATKLTTMRIFADDQDKMNLSVHEIGGSVLIVSQFTLAADISAGRRPSFTPAAAPDHARALIEHLRLLVQDSGVPVAQGRFGARMDVTLTNAGPVTFVVDVENGRVV